MFYEIEYNSSPITGVGKYKLKPQKIGEPKTDPIRELFGQMRDIARAHRRANDYSRFFDRRFRYDDEVIFYKQGIFMKDFTDDYPEAAAFSLYFPDYQMMGYEQLRTYFTWRAQVRRGNIANISLSYAFVYIYELLNNIGVENPQDGLDKLMAFWKGFSVYNNTIDKYMLSWLKDYHIYYELPHSFKEFSQINDIAGHYPKMTEADTGFGLFCAISKYDMRKSAFYTDETSKMISDCFSHIIERIRRDFEAAGMHFDNAFFRPTKRLVAWKPFKGALFYQRLKQPDRRVVFSENEIYVCIKNEWSFSTVITTEKGRRFIGYVMKQMEAELRKITGYKYRLTANISLINEDTLRILTKAGLHIENIVSAAVMEFHREATKTVITVDHTALARIRKEALATQEALIIDEQITPQEQNQNVFADFTKEPLPASGVWESFKNSLSENDLRALAVISKGGDIKAYADESGVFLEVLIEGINEKATDHIGDNLLDDNFALYDDYKDQTKELIK